MAMKPEQVRDAFIDYIEGRSRVGFDMLLDQLRDGTLVMEFTDEGAVIRTAGQDTRG